VNTRRAVGIAPSSATKSGLVIKLVVNMWFKSLLVAMFGVGVCCFSGCVGVTSREPLYDAQRDRISDRDLHGTWISDDMQVRIDSDQQGGYVWTSMDQPGLDAARFDLVRMDGRRYLFFTGSAPPQDDPPEAVEAERADVTAPRQEPRWSLPSFRVERAWGGLRLYALNGFGMHEMLRKQPGTLDYEFTPDEQWPPIYTLEDGQRTEHFAAGSLDLNDSAKSIRRFLNRHAKDKRLWVGPMEFRRADK
jgi:hypothetical protein